MALTASSSSLIPLCYGALSMNFVIGWHSVSHAIHHIVYRYSQLRCRKRLAQRRQAPADKFWQANDVALTVITT